MKPFVRVIKYRDGSVSYWFVNLNDKDYEIVEGVLSKYDTKGFSCRGQADGIMEELCAVLDDTNGWYD